MKKLFTSLIALAAVASAGAFTSQEVSDLSQIVDGGTYVFLNQHPDGNRVMTLSDDGSTITFATYSDETTAVANTKCHWLLTKTEDYTCAHTGYTSDNHKGIFFISQDGNYWKHATSASISTVTTPGDIATYFEFIKLSTNAGGSLSSDSQYFSILGNWQSSISTVMSCLVLDANGSANQYSARTDASVTYTASNYYTTYSQYFKIYRIVYTTAEKLAKLKETYLEKLTGLSNFGAYANSNYEAQIQAVTASTDNDLAAAETKMQTIVNQAWEAVATYYNNKYVVLLNYGNHTESGRTDQYLCLSPASNDYAGNSATITGATIWRLETAISNGAVVVKLRNPYAGTYIGLTTNSGNLPMAAEGSEYTLIAVGAQQEGYDHVFFRNGDLNIHYNGSDYAKDYTGTGGYSQWLIIPCSDEQIANITEQMKSAVLDTTLGYEISDQLNCYTTSEATVEAFKSAKATFETAANESNDFDAFCTAYRTAESAISSAISGSTFSLNMPQSGRYLRIYTAPAWCAANAWTTAPYLTCTNTVVDSNPYATFATAKDATSIMYFTGEGLIAYTNGRYAKSSSGKSMIYFTSDDEDASANTGATLSFIEGDGEAGTYSVKYSGTRYMYTGTGLYTNGGSSNSGGGYNFQLEYVDELPLTIGSDGAATFCAPVAVTIPSGTDCKFFTATLSGTDLTITPVNAGTECAAHTPIFVQGAADTTVNFPINYDAPEAESDENTVATFYANTAWSSFSEQEGYLTYMPTTATATETETDSSASAAPAIRRAASETTDATVAFAKLAAGGDITANVPILNVPTSSIGNSEPVETFTIDLSVTVPDTFSLVSVVTSINEVNADAAAQQPIYDLQGRRVTSTPTHGIFIFGNKIRRI
jgi:hypothetical protein